MLGHHRQERVRGLRRRDRQQEDHRHALEVHQRRLADRSRRRGVPGEGAGRDRARARARLDPLGRQPPGRAGHGPADRGLRPAGSLPRSGTTTKRSGSSTPKARPRDPWQQGLYLPMVTVDGKCRLHLHHARATAVAAAAWRRLRASTATTSASTRTSCRSSGSSRIRYLHSDRSIGRVKFRYSRSIAGSRPSPTSPPWRQSPAGR